MKRILILGMIFFVSSCSSLDKSVFYGGLVGGSLGIAGGATLSPDRESRVPNMAIWASVGALVGATLGHFFFMDDPENRELPSMLQGKLDKKSYELAPINQMEAVKISPKDSKKYKLETGPLPEHLKGKVQTPFIIEHEIPERIEHLENGKAITIEQHKAWEIQYE